MHKFCAESKKYLIISGRVYFDMECRGDMKVVICLMLFAKCSLCFFFFFFFFFLLHANCLNIF